jgi:hypothetical protein
MYLVLCSSMDIPAQWAHQGLLAHGLDARLLTAEMLESATQWEHHLDSRTNSISFVLSDGQAISGQEIDGVLNRLMAPSQNLARRAVPEDRDYALQETTAFYLSWLNSLSCPLLNQPTPQGLAGRWLHLSELTLFAHQAGLTTLAYRQTGGDAPEAGYQPSPSPSLNKTQVILLDGEVFGVAVPSAVSDGCRSLARLLQTRLLSVDFHSTPQDAWTFAFANPVPDLQIGGPRLVECLARTLQNGGRQ